MTNNYWEKAKWIFKHDGALRDIYIQNITLEDWMKLIDYLNNNCTVKFGPSGEVNSAKIDKQYISNLLQDGTDQTELRTASIIFDDIKINIHFFYDKEIEFDVDPREVQNAEDFDKVVNFMFQLSQVLNKKVILTGENQADFPLIQIQADENHIEIVNDRRY